MRKKKRIRIRFDRIFIFLLGVAMICGALIYAGMSIYRFYENNYAKQVTTPKPTYYLLLGINEEEKSQASTIAVCVVDSETEKMTFISIPRNTLVGRGDEEKTKMFIKDVYAEGGVEETKSSLENLLHIRIDHFIVYNQSTFAALLTHFGEIDFFVEKEMNHKNQDGSEDFYIHLGYQTLDADSSISYLRYLDSNQDEIARIQRQQRFIKAYLHKCKDGYSVMTWILIKNYWMPYYSDIDYKEAASLAYDILKFPEENYQFCIIPGDTEKKSKDSNAWIVNPIEMQKIIASTIN